MSIGWPAKLPLGTSRSLGRVFPTKIGSMTIFAFRTKPHSLIKILVSSGKIYFQIVSEIVNVNRGYLL